MFRHPPVGFRREIRRFYPGGPVAAHVLDLTNIDNQGLLGIEKWIDSQGLIDMRLTGLGAKGAFEPVQL